MVVNTPPPRLEHPPYVYEVFDLFRAHQRHEYNVAQIQKALPRISVKQIVDSLKIGLEDAKVLRRVYGKAKEYYGGTFRWATAEEVRHQERHPSSSSSSLPNVVPAVEDTAPLVIAPVEPVTTTTPPTSLGKPVKLITRVLEALRTGPATTPEIAVFTGIPGNTVSATLTLAFKDETPGLSRKAVPKIRGGMKFIYSYDAASTAPPEAAVPLLPNRIVIPTEKEDMHKNNNNNNNGVVSVKPRMDDDPSAEAMLYRGLFDRIREAMGQNLNKWDERVLRLKLGIEED